MKGGIKLAASDDWITLLSIPSYTKMVIKHPKTVDSNGPDPENVDIFFVQLVSNTTKFVFLPLAY